MSTVSQVKAFLDALGTLGTLTKGNMPASPDVIGTIYEYGGQAGEKGFGVSGIAYEKPAIQVVFRGVAFDYEGPWAKAKIALLALAAIPPDTVLSGSLYLSADPQQSPFPVEPIDANNRFKIGFNCYLYKEP